MKVGLKDYQGDAVADVLDRFDTARLLAERGKSSAVALTAPTGAGKTVMAAAVIETLFFGNDDFDVPPDPGATVLWFTSDPSLNEQTRHRLLQASEKLTSNRLRVVESTFSDERLRPGRVYFLNSQKLSKNARLVRGAGAAEGTEVLAAPDMRARTFWEVLANTMEHDGTTLYVFLDEAHIGMRTSARDLGEKSTIVRQLVNGEAGAPAVPIVFGISATIERYEESMKAAVGRTTLPPVKVDPVKVQESGLLKDAVLLSFPTEAGTFDTALLRHAVAQTRKASTLWRDYHESQGGTGEPVEPMLVVQMPNKPTDEQLGDAVRTVLDEWPGISSDNIANVFGEGTAIRAAGHPIDYVRPEDVAERTHVRVVLAKDAISTGWDCPRAEVLMSFRPAKDLTHITQLLGRMVRTPLARRIPSDDRLNSVECILPLFDRSAAEQVAHTLTRGNGGPGPGPPVMTETADFWVNPRLERAEEVWAAFESMPSETVPRRGSRPVSRFTALAAALARDDLKLGAYDAAMTALVAFLRGQAVQHESDVQTQIDDVMVVSGETLRVGMAERDRSQTATFALRADDRAVDSDYRVARRRLTPQLAAAYADVVEKQHRDGYFEAHLRTAALARVPAVLTALDAEADRLFALWDNEFRVAIKKLPDDRRETYDNLRALAGEPVRIDVQRPTVRREPVETLAGKPLATSAKHLLADETGRFPTGGLGGWEREVLETEIERCVAWYRNPSRASADALAIAYRDAAGEWRRLCPDFVFFENVRGGVRPSIVDPHGTHLGDALAKLRGLAAYAEQYGDAFHRIEAIAEVDDGLRVLDLCVDAARKELRRATTAEDVYRSAVAVDYR